MKQRSNRWKTVFFSVIVLFCGMLSSCVATQSREGDTLPEPEDAVSGGTVIEVEIETVETVTPDVPEDSQLDLTPILGTTPWTPTGEPEEDEPLERPYSEGPIREEEYRKIRKGLTLNKIDMEVVITEDAAVLAKKYIDATDCVKEAFAYLQWGTAPGLVWLSKGYVLLSVGELYSAADSDHVTHLVYDIQWGTGESSHLIFRLSDHIPVYIDFVPSYYMNYLGMDGMTDVSIRLLCKGEGLKQYAEITDPTTGEVELVDCATGEAVSES